jgi:uncharacterized membrane protein
MSPRDYLRLISSSFGFIAIGCVLAIGSYIAAWCWNIYSSGIGPDFLIPAEITWIATFASTLLLLFGTLKIMKKSMLKGGIINLIAGAIMIPVFLYFYDYFPLLPQFGPLGLLLFLPALLSGITSLASRENSKHEKTAKNSLTTSVRL